MKSTLKKYLLIITGELMVAFAISVFYTPNKIVSGGVSGLSTVLFYTLGIPTGVSFAVINLTLLIMALKHLGKSFVLKTLAGAMILSLFIQLFSYLPPFTDDLFLSTVFGAALYGIGTGLTLIEGASTGGTDILSRLVQCACPHVKIGNLLMLIDAIVITVSFIVFGQPKLVMYGIVALSISSFAINWLIQKLNISKLAFVVTGSGIEITKTLISNSPRGITLINATGGYTMEDKNVLICALKESETANFRKQILQIDPGAFIIFSESSQIIGNGFRVYK